MVKAQLRIDGDLYEVQLYASQATGESPDYKVFISEKWFYGKLYVPSTKRREVRGTLSGARQTLLNMIENEAQDANEADVQAALNKVVETVTGRNENIERA